jgi:RNA polymerase sigma-70 factor (ECF subfamily)
MAPAMTRGEHPIREVGPRTFNTTSVTLLDRVKADDPQAWRRLVHLYGPLIYRWCRRCRLGAEDAADVSQEVFRTVAARVGGFRRDRPGDSFRGWLWTITRHKIGDYLRRRERQPAAAGGSDAQMRLQQVPEQLSGEEEAADVTGLVHRALDLVRAEFEERTWRAFWRVAVQGLSPRVVAADLGVTPDAVRMAKSRVLRRLREELPELDGDWSSHPA